MPKQKKKIGWWRWLAKAFGLPLLGIGRQAAQDFIEQPPLQDFTILAVDITEEILNIYTDINPENKKQLKEMLDSRDSEMVAKSMALLSFLIPLVLEKIQQGKETKLKKDKLLRLQKALEE